MRLARLVDPDGGVTYYVLPERVESALRNYWPRASVEEVDGLCGYDVGAGWHPARCGNPEPCPVHMSLTCHCGKRALNTCSFASSLAVCGIPVCGDPHKRCERHAWPDA